MLISLLFIIILVISNLATYYYSISTIQANTITVTSFNTMTITDLREITRTITATETRTTIVPTTITTTIISHSFIRSPVSVYSVKRGDLVAIIPPFLYHDHILFYSENFTDILKRWVFEGEYELHENGILLGGRGVCSIAFNRELSLQPYTSYRLNITILEHEGSIRFTLYVPGARRHVASILVNKDMVATGYLGDNIAPYQRQVELGNVNELEFMFIFIYATSGELFLRRPGIDEDWVLIAQISASLLAYFDVKIGIETCDSKVLIRDLKANLAAGTGMRDLRPIYDWSNGKYNPKSILRDKDGYYLFFATESYFNHLGGLLFLRTRDLIHYEPVKSIIIRKPGYTGQGVLFKWIDGRIHGFLMDWSSGGPPFQGLHRILKVVLDEDFNVLEVDTNVRLIGGPSGGSMGHYDIAIVKFKGTWYAITSSFTGGTIVWKLEDPTKTTFTYVKTIFPSGFENPWIYPVIGPDGSIRFLLSVATVMVQGVQWHRIYVLDEEFNPITYYDMVQIKEYSGGHSFYLDPWYLYVHQDQFANRRFVGTDIGPGVYLEIYKLMTDYKYYIEE